MTNLEALLEFKPPKRVKCSGKTVMGVYADQEALDKLSKLCLGNCHGFTPCIDISEAKHILNNNRNRYNQIALDISLAEQNGYEFIEYLKAGFRSLKVYVTYAADSNDSMKTRLEEAQNYMGDNVLLVQWQHSNNTIPLEPKTQAGSSSEAADLSVFKNPQYNDPEDADVSLRLQLGLPKDASVSTKLQLGLPAKRKRTEPNDTNDPED